MDTMKTLKKIKEPEPLHAKAKKAKGITFTIKIDQL